MYGKRSISPTVSSIFCIVQSNASGDIERSVVGKQQAAFQSCRWDGIGGADR